MSLEKHINAKPLSDEEKKLCSIVDDKKDELIDLLKSLIGIDSRTYDPKIYSDLTEIFNFTEIYMKEAGFDTQIYHAIHPHGEKNENNKWPNLIAKWEGEEQGKFLQFNGHLDIVPFVEEQWGEGIHPLESVVKDGRQYGRGTADMKGGIAAQMMACKILKESDHSIKGKLQLWLVPDEEMDGTYGAQYMSDNHLDIVKADATLIGEPTGQPPIQSPAIIVGEKGHQWLRLKIFGSAGHGSMPKPKSNAINKTVKFIQNAKKKLKLPKVKAPIGIKQLVKSLRSRFTIKNMIKALKTSDGGAPDPYNEDGVGIGAFFNSTLSFTQIHSGTKVNVIPDVSELEIDIRILPGITTQNVFDSLANYCTKIGFRIQFPEGFNNIQKKKKILKRPVDIELGIIACTNGTFVEPTSQFTQDFADVFEDVYNVHSVFFFAPGSTDAVHMRERGIENVVCFGPTGGHTHDADEFVEVEHLIKVCKVYLITAYRMLVKPENLINQPKDENMV
jgi:succinyl-diaminopimelate desuccinylase